MQEGGWKATYAVALNKPKSVVLRVLDHGERLSTRESRCCSTQRRGALSWCGLHSLSVRRVQR
jgi:hypothetical protein